jgi:RES domain-containing protein
MALFDADRLSGLRGSKLSVTGYRNQAGGFDPRSGEGARRFGGRFNPPASFPVIYLCSSQPCVVAELTRQAQRQGLAVADLLPRELWQITGDLTKVLDLTRPNTLKAIGLRRVDLVRDDLQLTREIGAAAYARGFQAIRSASATGVDDVIAIMPDNLAGTALQPELIQTWSTLADIG